MTTRLNAQQQKPRRRALRKQMTPAEAFLWTLIRNKQLEERFLRQYSVDNYVLDFYCPKHRLAVELDGAGHFTPQGAEYDQRRTAHLVACGIKVLRFENEDIFNYPDRILETIRDALEH